MKNASVNRFVMNKLWTIVSRSESKASDTLQKTTISTQTLEIPSSHRNTQTPWPTNDSRLLQLQKSIDKLREDIRYLQSASAETNRNLEVESKNLLSRVCRKIEDRERYYSVHAKQIAEKLDKVETLLSETPTTQINGDDPGIPRIFVPSSLKPIGRGYPPNFLSVGRILYAKGPEGNWNPARVRDVECELDGETVNNVSVEFIHNKDLRMRVWGNHIATHLRENSL